MANYVETPVTDGAVISDANKLFDVTCIIGSVYAGGSVSPYVAGMRLIADFGEDGEFSFPLADRIVQVSISSAARRPSNSDSKEIDRYDDGTDQH